MKPSQALASKKKMKEINQISNSSEPSKSVSSADPKSTEQIEQLNKHLGAIESKVQEMTKKYEELKKAD